MAGFPCLSSLYLYTGKDADTPSLLTWAEPPHQSPSAGLGRPECCQDHDGLDQQAGETEDKADPKRSLLEPTRPHRRLTNKHQRAQEAELE